MKRFGFSSALIGMLGFAALVLVAATPAKAGFVVGGENGWQMSYDGMINVFMVYSTQSNQTDPNRQAFRIRTGLLPSIFGFNVKSPTINGVDYSARLGLYPQIQNAGTRTGLQTGADAGASLDIREVFFTADGKFGQFLIGRAINLYQAKNILTDMTLLGNGVPNGFTGGAVDLGHIGHGYTYCSFGPQFRYTTPDMGGAKIAFAIADPSQIGTGAVAHETINQPRFEAEMSYVKNLGSVKLNTWVSALYQEAKQGSTQHKVSSIGGAGGVQATMGNFGMVLSGFGGQGIGMLLTQDDASALDDSGKERVSFGGLLQTTYTIGKAKLGVQYGINYLDRSEYDEATADRSMVKSQQAITGGVYYSVNKYLLLVGEYTFARDQLYTGVKTDTNVISLGTVFTW